MSARGRLITLEGGEGAGKSTLARSLAAALTNERREIVLTREPGGSPGAEEIRALLLRGEGDRWSPIAETLLFVAARSDHIERLIRPALARGAWVICDRYTDSTLAYQVGGHGLARATVDALHAAIGAESPDLTLILDLDHAVGLNRSRSGAAGEARFETMDGAFHARVRQTFLEIAKADPTRCVVIPAAEPKEKALDFALRAIHERLA